MILTVRALAVGALLLLFTIGPARAQPMARVPPGLRVSVQPINGELGPTLQSQIARLLRGRGCRVMTSLPRVGGTGQYLTMAKDHRLAAFVSADIQEGRSRHTITFLVWDGASGSVRGRWTASAAPKKLPKAVAKGFWKALGPRFDGVQAPPSDELEPAPPMYVNAGEPIR